MNEWIDLARCYFLSYCHIINANFQSSEHHIQIAKVLDQIADGVPKRLIVSLPPRHGKSFLISQHFPTFYMGRNPKKNIISTAYNQSLAEDFGNYVKKLMLTDEYKAIFPYKIDITSKSKKRFSLEQGGNYYAVGKGGPITGRGANLIIIDDLIKNEQEARSEVHRKHVIDWYKNTLRTRLQPKGSIIIVQTRWHEGDLIGDLLKNSREKWEYIKFPAISEEGKALWPEFYPIDMLQTMKAELGSMVFQGLYQQEPCLDDGYYIKADWIQRYKDVPAAIPNYIITADLTFKGEKHSDYVAIQLWGLLDSNFYLIDMIRGQFDFTQQLFHVKQFIEKHKDKCQNVLIEDAANGAAVYATIKKHVTGLRLWKPQTSKEGRVIAVSPMFEAKNVFIPEDPAFDIVVSELLGFPNAAHDDTVDACSMALLNLKNKKRVLISMSESLY